MASISQPQGVADGYKVPEAVRQLRTSNYDQVTGILMSLVTLIGFCVVTLVLIWVFSQVWFVPKPAPLTLLPEPEPGGGGNGAPSLNDLDEPVPEEIEQVDEPPPEVVLEAITDLASLQLAVVDHLKPMYQGRGPGRGTGDGRGMGPGGDGDADIVPRWERWVIKYSTDSTEAYARQLDFFKIELGAVGGTNGGQNIDYVADMSTSSKRRSAPADQEKRLYMTWRKGSELEKADVELLTVAGVRTQGRIVMQLYPKEVEDQLATIESERAGGRDVRGILKTIFGVRMVAGGRYEYFVIDQFYRSFRQ